MLSVWAGVAVGDDSGSAVIVVGVEGSASVAVVLPGAGAVTRSTNTIEKLEKPGVSASTR